MIHKNKTGWRWTATADAAALLWSQQQLRRRALHDEQDAAPSHCRRDGLAVGRRASDYTSSYEQLRDLSGALQQTREEERAHIARELYVEDNGAGIAPTDLAKPQSFGLIGMRERVWALSGEIAIGSLADSTDGHGTRIAIELPLPATPLAAAAKAVG